VRPNSQWTLWTLWTLWTEGAPTCQHCHTLRASSCPRGTATVCQIEVHIALFRSTGLQNDQHISRQFHLAKESQSKNELANAPRFLTGSGTILLSITHLTAIHSLLGSSKPWGTLFCRQWEFDRTGPLCCCLPSSHVLKCREDVAPKARMSFFAGQPWGILLGACPALAEECQ